jgi:hypothetical protein
MGASPGFRWWLMIILLSARDRRYWRASRQPCRGSGPRLPETGSGVSVPRRVAKGGALCVCGVITHGAQLPGTGSGREPRQEGHVGPLDGLLTIRRLRQVVQDCLLQSVGWADIPQLSTRDKRCPAAWQQYWQQPWPNGTDPRPSDFQAGHILSWRGSCERYALWPVVGASRWSLPLLSPLLSAAFRGSVARA